MVQAGSRLSFVSDGRPLPQLPLVQPCARAAAELSRALRMPVGGLLRWLATGKRHCGCGTRGAGVIYNVPMLLYFGSLHIHTE